MVQPCDFPAVEKNVLVRQVAKPVLGGERSGVLANPRTPCIEGVETFQGASFHTAQWNHDVSLPGIRHLKRFLIFGYHEVRFIAFRRYPFTTAISRLMKKLYARNLSKNLEKYIADDRLRRHMMPDYELGCRRVIPTNRYLPALARENVDVDISGIERITPDGIRTRDGKDIPLINRPQPLTSSAPEALRLPRLIRHAPRAARPPVPPTADCV